MALSESSMMNVSERTGRLRNKNQMICIIMAVQSVADVAGVFTKRSSPLALRHSPWTSTCKASDHLHSSKLIQVSRDRVRVVSTSLKAHRIHGAL